VVFARLPAHRLNTRLLGQPCDQALESCGCVPVDQQICRQRDVAAGGFSADATQDHVVHTAASHDLGADILLDLWATDAYYVVRDWDAMTEILADGRERRCLTYFAARDWDALAEMLSDDISMMVVGTS
jgi:hypothetical protein